jgi:hypothetical protein
VVVGSGAVPGQAGRRLAGAARPVVHGIRWIVLIAPTIGPEHRRSDDGHDPDEDSYDEESAHDGYDRVAHGYIQPRGRK